MLASMHAHGVPAVEIVRQRHDRWPLAYLLGEIDGARDVHATVSEGARIHYYSLVTRGGRALRIELRSTGAAGRPGPRVRMALAGPDLPRAKASIPEVDRGAGLVLSRPLGTSAGSGEVLQVRLPRRSRCTLVVQVLDARPGTYRLRFDGRGERSLGALLRFPLRQLEVEYLVWPQRTGGRLLALALGCAALLGLRALGWRLRVTRSGGFKG